MKEIHEVLNMKRAQILELKRQVAALEAASHALQAVDYLLAEEKPAEDSAPAKAQLSLIEDRPSTAEQVAAPPQPPKPEMLDRVDYQQEKVS